MLKARQSITIVGWDIDSRTRLVGEKGEANDGLPAELGDFLKALSDRTPGLRIKLLLWDFSALYALEREAFPRAKLAWEKAELCLDDCLPVGSSQHQKIVLIDDCIAFNGGLDLTIRRWDTARHLASDPHRVDPAGEPYDPFHDVQAVVDGDAAVALADLVRQRWRDAAGEQLPASEKSFAERDCWPDDVTPHFTDVQVGIARTSPAHDAMPEVREVEQLFLDMIDAARKSLYIENQYLTSGLVAERLADNLRRKPDLNVLIIAPRSHDPWLEAMTMQSGRIRFRKILESSGAPDRFRIVYPRVRTRRGEKPVMVHSKVMIVDDRIVRIGSANLNNRSMGADSECDLVIEANSDAERKAVTGLRNGLMAMHCGATKEDVDRVLEEVSLVEASRRIASGGKSLEDILDPETSKEDYASYLERIADPERPIDGAAFLSLATGDAEPGVRLRTARRLMLVALPLLAIAAAWTYFTQDVEGLVTEAIQEAAASPFAWIAVVSLYVLGGFLLVPITLLIVGTAATFGIVWGPVYAAIGTLASAILSYGLGAWLGRASVRRLLGGRLLKVRNAIARRGAISIAAIRMVPVAPFTVVNLAAGATNIGFVPYVAGTVLGMAPGFIILSALGQSLYRL
ncbi:MAG TPA: VTT domain-containing protein, partial [Fimbriimonas sp.]|nr:VTT domain-containing protein [Fimbriimonas sp.]